LGDRGVWSFAASAPLIIGSYEEPFRYDGFDVRPLEGEARVDVSALADQGSLIVDVATTEESGPIVVSPQSRLTGSIRLVMEEFAGTEPFKGGGIVEALRLHGDTGRMSAAMPELLAHLAGWGRIDLYLNGELRYEALDAHFMVTESVRRGEEEGYAVLRASDDTIYEPSLDDKTGFVYSQDLELHIWARSSSESRGLAPDEDVFLHLNLRVDGSPSTENTSAVSIPEEPEEPEGPSGGGSKGNNGLGNGVDPQPPGNPPINDGEGSEPGRGRK
jgi:hypothetical protein